MAECDDLLGTEEIGLKQNGMNPVIRLIDKMYTVHFLEVGYDLALCFIANNTKEKKDYK